MNSLLTNTINASALRGRKALVFGASSGIGFACAKTLAAMGAELVIVARNQEKLEQAKKLLSENNKAGVIAKTCDITDINAMQDLLSECSDVDILLTNCGGPPVAPFESFSLDQWEAAWQGQLRSVVQASTVLVPAMAERGWGRIIMLASITIAHPMKGFALSNSIRPGLVGLAATLTQEYAGKGVTANAICPGITATERMEKLIDQAVEQGQKRSEVIAQWTQNIPSSRLASADEIAALAGFLASDSAAFITGQAIVTDGGQSVVG